MSAFEKCSTDVSNEIDRFISYYEMTISGVLALRDQERYKESGNHFYGRPYDRELGERIDRFAFEVRALQAGLQLLREQKTALAESMGAGTKS